jgi:hypothetical protein
MYLKLLEKQEQANPKSSRWPGTIKIRAEINELETKQNNIYVHTHNESMKQKVGPLKK